MATTTLEKVKAALRISHSALDAEIQESIDACLADLKVCGVKYADEYDPLMLNAIKLYCRAQYTDDPVKGAEFLRRYDALKACLMMAEGYGREAGADE